MYDPGDPSTSTQALWNTIAKSDPDFARFLEENYCKPRNPDDAALSPAAKAAVFSFVAAAFTLTKSISTLGELAKISGNFGGGALGRTG
jgi:hypothetical protein